MNKVTVSKRTKAYFIDWLFMIAFFLNLFVLIRAIIWMVFEIWKTVENDSMERIANIFFLIGTILFMLIFPIFKDLIFPCGNVGFKIMKIKVIDQKSELSPTKKQLMLRGLLFYFYIIDIVVSRVRLDNLSLSDIVTNTKLVSQFAYDTE